MDSVKLESLGLSKNESKVYLALIKLGSASVAQISKIADVHRVNIYDTIERLKEKGLISSTIKVNKKYYEPASPENIKVLLDEKQEEINQIKQDLPNLIKIFNDSKNKQEIHSFKGIQGIKTALKDVLDTKPKEILNFGSTGGLLVKSQVNFDIWESQRENKKIPMKIITSNLAKQVAPKKKYQEIKFLEKEFANFTSTIVYADKVGIFMWTEEPIAVLIESKELAGSYKNYFYSLWG